MPSQFFGLNIAYTGLLGANAGLNTTANNISNSETEGYSRQEVNQVAASAIRTFTTYGCAGAGVDVLSIERVHDDFYDQKYWSNNTNTGEFSMKEYYMTQIEDYFRDDNTIEGFNSVFDKMMETLAEVKKNPASESTKSQFIGFGANLCQYFNSMAGSLNKVQDDVNAEIKIKIDEINSLASDIATLNKQINVIEISGTPANELRDRRTLLVDQLSKIVSVEVNEYDIIDSNDPDRATGGTQYIIKIAGGQNLVDTSDYRQLTCIARTTDEKINQSDVDGLYDVYWVANTTNNTLGDQFNLYNIMLGGELEGLVHLRDGNNSENFRGTISSVGTVDTATGIQQIKVEVKDSYLKDLNKSTLSNTGGKISLGNTQFYYDDWKYEYDETTGKCFYTFDIDSKKSGEYVTNDKTGKEAEIGQPIKYQGVPYYQEQLNEWCRIFSNAFNSILESGYTADGDPGVLMFTANEETGSGQMAFTEKYSDGLGNLKTSTITSKSDSLYRLTASNFSVLDSMIRDSGLLATKTDPAAGVDDYSNVTNLTNMCYDKNIANYRGASTSEFLTCILSDVALNTNNAETFKNNYENIGNSINNQRIAISGVDVDDESVNLVRYQNAYTLASKMIQTLTEIYDRLILQTGV